MPWHSQEAGTTYFRVSLLLQVEQEKQFTHHALLRADTTVGAGASRLSRPRLAQDQLGLQLQDQHARGRAGTCRGEGAQGQRSLTITLNHMAAVIADVPKEL